MIGCGRSNAPKIAVDNGVPERSLPCQFVNQPDTFDERAPVTLVRIPE